MDREKMESFIRRIIETSKSKTDALLALEQLEEILRMQASAEELDQFSMARSGVSDSLPMMQKTLRTEHGTEGIRVASERAKQQRIQEEIAAAHGRC